MNKVGQMFSGTRTFFGEVQAELKKCAWPTRSELLESTIVVMVSVLIITAAVGLSDLVLLQFMNLVMR